MLNRKKWIAGLSFVALTTASSLGWAYHRRNERRVAMVDRERVEAILQRSEQNLRRVEWLSKSLDYRRRGSMDQTVGYLSQDLANLRAELRDVPDGDGGGNGYRDHRAQASPVGQEIPAEAFAQAKAMVQAARLDAGKLQVLGDLARGNWFASWEARELVGLFSCDRAKLDALVVLAPRLVTPHDVYQLDDAFVFEQSRAQARATLASAAATRGH